MSIEVLISKQGTLVSLSIEAAGLIVQELKTLTDQNREYNNSINSGIDMLNCLTFKVLCSYRKIIYQNLGL